MIEALAPLMARAGGSWVARQRERHRPEADPLDPANRSALQAFYSADTLDRVRVRTVVGLDPPPLFETIRRLGVSLPLEMDRIAGIAFVDTLVVHAFVPEVDRIPILFHELVHVVQYHRLGLEGFMDRYVRGWLEADRRYRDIPLESDAYELAARFVEAPEQAFDVESEVDRRLAAPRSPVAPPRVPDQ
ncbi:MAG: hypothetical protein KY397_02870 [Gemmatimonadetes bacterium]|nr:hypothetical protein [Gemmatimonadota bacterium]